MCVVPGSEAWRQGGLQEHCRASGTASPLVARGPTDRRRWSGAGSRAFQHVLLLDGKGRTPGPTETNEETPRCSKLQAGLGLLPGGASPHEQRRKKTLSGLSEESGAALCLKLSVKSEICNRKNISLLSLKKEKKKGDKPDLCTRPFPIASSHHSAGS